MSLTTARCLILACGNTLRGDDGTGPWLAEWAEKRFAAEAGVRVVIRQQWAPELAEELNCSTLPVASFTVPLMVPPTICAYAAAAPPAVATRGKTRIKERTNRCNFPVCVTTTS